jgi:hypothetical protein
VLIPICDFRGACSPVLDQTMHVENGAVKKNTSGHAKITTASFCPPSFISMDCRVKPGNDEPN